MVGTACVKAQRWRERTGAGISEEVRGVGAAVVGLSWAHRPSLHKWNDDEQERDFWDIGK